MQEKQSQILLKDNKQSIGNAETKADEYLELEALKKEIINILEVEGQRAKNFKAIVSDIQKRAE